MLPTSTVLHVCCCCCCQTLAMCSALVIVLALAFPATVRAACGADADRKTFRRDPVQVRRKAALRTAACMHPRGVWPYLEQQADHGLVLAWCSCKEPQCCGTAAVHSAHAGCCHVTAVSEPSAAAALTGSTPWALCMSSLSMHCMIAHTHSCHGNCAGAGAVGQQGGRCVRGRLMQRARRT